MSDTKTSDLVWENSFLVGDKVRVVFFIPDSYDEEEDNEEDE